MEIYPLVKMFHMATAATSVTLFLVRGYIILGRQATPAKPLKILPHVNDTLLLVSALFLLHLGDWPFTETPWLMAKVGLLVLYILLGIIAFRQFFPRPVSLAVYLLALCSVFSIIHIAVSKSVSFMGLI